MDTIISFFTLFPLSDRVHFHTGSSIKVLQREFLKVHLINRLLAVLTVSCYELQENQCVKMKYSYLVRLGHHVPMKFEGQSMGNNNSNLSTTFSNEKVKFKSQTAGTDNFTYWYIVKKNALKLKTWWKFLVDHRVQQERLKYC